MNYSPDEVMSMMKGAGVPAGARRVTTGLEFRFEDEQLKERHFWVVLDHPVIGEYKARRPTFLLSKVPYEMRRAPLIGEHNEYVFKEILGMSDEEIEKLVIEGVID